MVKILHSNLQSALSSEVQTLARCCRITTTAADVLGFTNFDSYIVIDGITYRSSDGFTPTALQADTGFEANNAQLASILSVEGINSTDLKVGKYDYSRILIFLINYLDVPSSLNLNPSRHLVLLSGSLGKISYSESDYTAEILSLTQYLQGKTSWTTSKTCRYQFGDSKCTVDLDSVKLSAAVDIADYQDLIIDQDPQGSDRLIGGKLTWTNGPNNGITASIISQVGRSIWLSVPMPVKPEPGDEFDIIPNCQKLPQNCKFYNNFVNFGGETLVGLDQYYSNQEQE